MEMQQYVSIFAVGGIGLAVKSVSVQCSMEMQQYVSIFAVGGIGLAVNSVSVQCCHGNTTVGLFCSVV